MTTVHFYFRHPGKIYFSIEKLFGHIAKQINEDRPRYFNVSLFYLPLPSGLMNLWRNISYTRETQSVINHITGDVHYAILRCSSKNVNVLTIHDCVMLRRLKRSSPKFWFIKWLWYDLPVKKADMVTVISEYTKRELIHFTGCDENRIRIIGNFSDNQFQHSPSVFNQQEPLLLFIGTAENKNLDRLIIALRGLKLKLHIVGNPNETQIQSLKQHKISYKISSGLSDEAMRQAYIDCDMLCFPSIYEGFGLPIMEAQQTGRPVLTSNISPMKEIAADTAELVNPFDPDDIKRGILNIIQNDEFRETLIEKGFENVKRFELSSIAKQYSSLYEELIMKKQIIAD